MEHFSDRLRHARKKRKLSQAALARASGLSQGAISSYETGARKTTTGIIELAHALGVNPIWLMAGTGPIESAQNSTTLPEPASKLRDIEQQPVSVTWPFSSIQPSQYWALPQRQRRIVEQTVAAMIAALHNEHDNS